MKKLNDINTDNLAAAVFAGRLIHPLRVLRTLTDS